MPDSSGAGVQRKPPEHILIKSEPKMTDQVIKQAVLVFDSTGNPTTIIVDGRAYTSLPSASYSSPRQDAKNGTIPVEIEIPAGDYSRAGSLPAYTVFHHGNGARKSIASHS